VKISDSKEPLEWLGTKQFTSLYGVHESTQKTWRDNGMPFYQIPKGKKILYKKTEIEEWITSRK
jgi:hypothetical protein